MLIGVGRGKADRNTDKLYYRGAPRSWGSSVSIVSECRLDDWGSIPDRGKGFFL
jgi:hypothetical protein